MAIILAAYLVAGTLYAVLTPPWQAPDEPAHYNYVRQLADGEWPVITAGDYDQEYQGFVISSKFDPRYSVDAFEYEDYQPPLYYILLTPVYLLFAGALIPLRLVSVLLGAGVVVAVFGVMRALRPPEPWLAATAAAFVAFIPQHVAMLAAVNNDSLAELIIGLTVWLMLAGPGRSAPDLATSSSASATTATLPATFPSPRRLLAISILLGLGLLTKATTYILVPVAAIWLYVIWYRAGRTAASQGEGRTSAGKGERLSADAAAAGWHGSWQQLGRDGVLLFGPAALLGALWWGRNIIVYGGLDVLGLGAHNDVVVGQPLTADWINSFGLGDTLKAFWSTSFHSFWGQFGWMALPMPDWIYWLLLLFTLLLLGGLGLAFWDIRPVWPATRQKWGLSWLVLGGIFSLNILLYVGYNLTFVQHQGRYMFASLLPIGLGVAIALGAYARRWPGLKMWLPWLVGVGLWGLDLWALWRWVVPGL